MAVSIDGRQIARRKIDVVGGGGYACESIGGGELPFATKMQPANRFPIIAMKRFLIAGVLLVVTCGCAHAQRSSLDERRNQLLLLEIDGKHGTAASGWNSMIGDLKTMVWVAAPVVGLKERHDESFFHYVYCMYRFGEKHKNAKKKQNCLRRAARLIVELKDRDLGNWNKKFEVLLRVEPELAQAYGSLLATQLHQLPRGACSLARPQP